MSKYNITAQTLDSMMAIYVAQVLPRGIRSKDAGFCAEEFATKVCKTLELPENLIDEAVLLFQRRFQAAGIAG